MEGIGYSFLSPILYVLSFQKKTQDVVQLVRWARKHKIALIPSGGRTGLSGGATAERKEVIVSFEKMNKLIEFNEFEETLCVQPGMITKEVQKQAVERELFMPISFSAEGSSQIGGNVATNAGGIHVIQYGLMRRWVRGIQVGYRERRYIKLRETSYKRFKQATIFFSCL